jgi:uncharacterized membrane protein
MTSDQINGLVRTIIAAVGGYFAVKGIGDEAMWTAIAGGVGVVAAAVWSWWAKKPAAPAA